MSGGRPNVAVLGGGYAGMAAAVTLAERGVPVTVYEAASHLGGRARRVEYNGIALDNGLHVLIGACSETLRLIELVNRDAEHALLRLPLDWRIHDRFRMRIPALPAPLHLVAALLTARGMGLRARYSAARFIRALRARHFRIETDISVRALLAAYRQDEAAIRYLWQPLCTSALNTPMEQASARVFLNMLRDALSASAANSDLLVARHDLTALFPEPAAEYIRTRGAEILLGHTVSEARHDGGVFRITARGTARTFSHIVCALSPHRLRGALSAMPKLNGVLSAVECFRYQPIYSVYLQYSDQVRLPLPMIGLADGVTQWVFDREAICCQAGLLAAVISSSGSHQQSTHETLAERVQAELALHFGPLPPLKWRRVIAEKRATFSCSVGITRPQASTAVAGFHLAGDYVESDYPATLEGAVRSGVRAARALLQSF